MKTCAIEGCNGEALVDGLCVECNDDWKNSDERASAEHVEQMARESFRARLSARKATTQRVTAGLTAMVESLRPVAVHS